MPKLKFIMSNVPNKEVEYGNETIAQSMIVDLQSPGRRFIGVFADGKKWLLNKDHIIEVEWME